MNNLLWGFFENITFNSIKELESGGGGAEIMCL